MKAFTHNRVLGTIPSPLTQVELSYRVALAARVERQNVVWRSQLSVSLLTFWEAGQIRPRMPRTFLGAKFVCEIASSMTPGVYVNFMSGDEDDRTTEAYRTMGSLGGVKAHYDPDNLFRLNQNIPPQKAG